MIIYKDILTGDELISDSYKMTEIEDGFFYEVEGKWVVVGNDDDVNIGANPSAEGGDDEGVESSQRRVVDIIDGFRLCEQPSYDKKTFLSAIKTWLGKVLEKLPDDQKDEFKAKSQTAVKFLISKLKELQFFVGESMDTDGTMVFAYYKENASDPTFLIPKYALEEMKC